MNAFIGTSYLHNFAFTWSLPTYFCLFRRVYAPQLFYYIVFSRACFFRAYCDSKNVVSQIVTWVFITFSRLMLERCANWFYGSTYILRREIKVVAYFFGQKRRFSCNLLPSSVYFQFSLWVLDCSKFDLIFSHFNGFPWVL